VEVKVEGLDLNPDRACQLLATCLHELDTLLEKILLEEERSRGDARSCRKEGPSAEYEAKPLPPTEERGLSRAGPSWTGSPPCAPQRRSPT